MWIRFCAMNLTNVYCRIIFSVFYFSIFFSKLFFMALTSSNIFLIKSTSPVGICCIHEVEASGYCMGLMDRF